MAVSSIFAALQKRPVFFTVFATVSLVVLAAASFVRFQDSDSPFVTQNPKEADSYVRNLTWETEFFATVPYRKEDDLEFAFFADYPRPYSYVFDWNAILERYSFVSLSDGSEVLPENLSLKKYRGESKLFLRLRSKLPGTTGNDRSVRPKIVFYDRETDSVPDVQEKSDISASGAIFSEIPPEKTRDGSEYSLPVRIFSSDVNNAVSVS